MAQLQAQAIDAAYFYESFESCELPEGWSTEGGAKDWQFGGIAELPFLNENSAYQDHSCHAFVDVHENDNQYLITSAIQLENAVLPFLYFEYGGWLGGLILEIHTEADGWQPLGEPIGSWSTDWAEKEVLLPVTDGEIRLRFSHADGSFSYGLGLDNVLIYESSDIVLIDAPAVRYLEPGTHPVNLLIQERSGNGAFNTSVFWQLDNGPIHESLLEFAESYRPTNFLHGDEITIEETGKYQFKAWIENSEQTINRIASNDEISFEIQVVKELPKKRVLVEHHSGDYCCPCVASIVAYRNFLEQHTDEAIGVCYHHGDMFAIGGEEFQGVDADLFTAYDCGAVPIAALDRSPFQLGSFNTFNNANWELKMLNRPPFSVRIINAKYDDASQLLSYDIKIRFVADYSGEPLHLNSSLIEDEINSPQECADDPYYHPDVARTIFGGVWGWDDIIPAEVSAGDEFVKQVQYTVPDEFDLNQARLVAYVQSFGDLRTERTIVNAIDGWLIDLLNGIVEPSVGIADLNSQFSVYPNPTSGTIQIQQPEINNQITELNLVLQNGSKIGLEKYQSALTHSTYLPILSNGIYFLEIITENGRAVKKIIVER